MPISRESLAGSIDLVLPQLEREKAVNMSFRTPFGF
jgi:hypothetical protein